MGGDRPKKREKKKLCPDFRSYSAWGRKFRKEKKAKKFKKLKNLFPALFLAKTGDEIGREREKKKI